MDITLQLWTRVINTSPQCLTHILTTLILNLNHFQLVKAQKGDISSKEPSQCVFLCNYTGTIQLASKL